MPRSSLGAIEGGRLTPAVSAALAIARALEYSVEELFGTGAAVSPADSGWAWEPGSDPCRFWEAEVGGRLLLFPAEALPGGTFAHDGVHRGGVPHGRAGRGGSGGGGGGGGLGGGGVGDGGGPDGGGGRSGRVGLGARDRDDVSRTLVLAGCDPASGLLASEYAAASGLRLLAFSRGGGPALELLRQGVVHVAAIHRSTAEHPGRNAETVRERLGPGFRLLRCADWEEGVALPREDRTRSVRAVARGKRLWALRESGSAARECLDEITGATRHRGRTESSHAAVAESVRAGWAQAGVCVRLCAEDAGLRFLPVRTESLDLCFRSSMESDPRLQALIRLLRSRRLRSLVGDLPGYDARETGALSTVTT